MKIVIVGGGTAGWLAALIISKVHKETHSVSLIESASIGTIGVGESSTGLLRGVINNEVWNYGCNEIDFIKYTNATPKLGIYYKNWGKNNESYFEPTDTCPNNMDLWTNPILTSYVANDIPMHMSSINGRLSEYRLSSYYYDDFNNICSIKRNAYTFDAKLAAKYFENICGKDVERIQDKIVDISLKENGFVDFLLLESNKKVYGDFFIDASGFQRLFSKKLNVSWKSYQEELTVNSALPFLIDHEDLGDLNFFSTSVAMKNGWMWMHPKLDKLACGYVYDNNHIDENEAQKELEEYLNIEINPIKNLNFKSGSMTSFWNKNVLSIGLSSSFLEPLEATSIHGTIAQLNLFVFSYLKETMDLTMNEYAINIYNRNIEKMLNNFKDFVLIHYANNKDISPFWKNINNIIEKNDTIKELIEIGKYRLLNKNDIETIYGYANAETFNWVLIGLNIFNKNSAKNEMNFVKKINLANNQEDVLVDYISNKNWLSNKEFLYFLRNS